VSCGFGDVACVYSRRFDFAVVVCAVYTINCYVLDGVQYLSPECLQSCYGSFAPSIMGLQRDVCTEAEKAGLNEHRLSGEMHRSNKRPSLSGMLHSTSPPVVNHPTPKHSPYQPTNAPTDRTLTWTNVLPTGASKGDLPAYRLSHNVLIVKCS